MEIPSTRTANLGLLMLRLMVGAVFVIHGAQKLFVNGLPRFGGALGQMGVPLPNVAAVVVTMVEFVGGALVLVGLFARPAAALIAIDMMMAIVLVHGRNGFFLPRGYEYALTLLVLNLSLVLLGAGAWSIDGWVARDRAAVSRESPRVG